MNPAHTSWRHASQAVFPVASLADHHRRATRTCLRTAHHARWDLAQTWRYITVYCRADIFAELTAAARHRQALACLLAIQRDGHEYVTAMWCRHQTGHAGKEDPHGWD